MQSVTRRARVCWSPSSIRTPLLLPGQPPPPSPTLGSPGHSRPSRGPKNLSGPRCGIFLAEKRKRPRALEEGRSQSRARTYLAVVRRTNRLTMLFSRVLKYCGGEEERRGRGRQAEGTPHREQAAGGGPPPEPSPSLPHPLLPPKGSLKDGRGTSKHGVQGLLLPELNASSGSRQLALGLVSQGTTYAQLAELSSTAPLPKCARVPNLTLETPSQGQSRGSPLAFKEGDSSNLGDGALSGARSDDEKPSRASPPNTARGAVQPPYLRGKASHKGRNRQTC